MKFKMASILVCITAIVLGCSTHTDEPPIDGLQPSAWNRFSNLDVEDARNLLIGFGAEQKALTRSGRDEGDVNLLFKVTEGGDFESVVGIDLDITSDTNGVVTTNFITNVVNQPFKVYNASDDYLMILFQAEGYNIFDTYLIDKTTGDAIYLDRTNYGVPWNKTLFGGGHDYDTYCDKYDKVQSDSSGNIYYISVYDQGSGLTVAPRTLVKLNVSDPNNIVKTELTSPGMIGNFFVDAGGNVIYCFDVEGSGGFYRRSNGETGDVPSNQFWLGVSQYFYYRIQSEYVQTNGVTNFITNINPNPSPPPDYITNITESYSGLDCYVDSVYRMNLGSSSVLWSCDTNKKYKDCVFPDFIDTPRCFKLHLNDPERMMIVGSTLFWRWGGSNWETYEAIFVWDSAFAGIAGMITEATNYLRTCINSPGEDRKLFVNAASSDHYIYIAGYGRDTPDSSSLVGAGLCLVKINTSYVSLLIPEGTYEEILFSVSTNDYVLFSGMNGDGSWDIGEIDPSETINYITNGVDYNIEDMANM